MIVQVLQESMLYIKNKNEIKIKIYKGNEYYSGPISRKDFN